MALQRHKNGKWHRENENARSRQKIPFRPNTLACAVLAAFHHGKRQKRTNQDYFLKNESHSRVNLIAPRVFTTFIGACQCQKPPPQLTRRVHLYIVSISRLCQELYANGLMTEKIVWHILISINNNNKSVSQKIPKAFFSVQNMFRYLLLYSIYQIHYTFICQHHSTGRNSSICIEQSWLAFFTL